MAEHAKAQATGAIIRMKPKGLFITFEGSEGCGKSTQARLLYRYLRRRGKRVVFLREPGGTAISEKIRQLLLDKKNTRMSAEAEMLLYMAARAQVVAQLIRPALERGTIVLCDRFLDSTLAYQGYGLGMDLRLIKCVGRFATQGISPDLTILLDVPLKEGLAHRARSQDRIEQRPLKYHERVRRGYFALARGAARRITVIRVEADLRVTQRNIRALLERRFGR